MPSRTQHLTGNQISDDVTILLAFHHVQRSFFSFLVNSEYRRFFPHTAGGLSWFSQVVQPQNASMNGQWGYIGISIGAPTLSRQAKSTRDSMCCFNLLLVNFRYQKLCSHRRFLGLGLECVNQWRSVCAYMYRLFFFPRRRHHRHRPPKVAVFDPAFCFVLLPVVFFLFISVCLGVSDAMLLDGRGLAMAFVPSGPGEGKGRVRGGAETV